MKKIKIAFFIDTLKEDLDGVSVTSHQIISRLPSFFEAIFFTPVPPTAKNFKYKVYTVRSLTFPYANDYQLAFPKQIKTFEILDEFGPDLIHWSSPTFLGSCAAKYAKSRAIPNISIYHAHFHSYLGYFNWVPFKSFIRSLTDKKLLKIYRRADRLLAPTQEMENYLRDIGLESNKLKVWGRGVDCIRFNPEKRQDDYYFNRNIPEGKKILFVSRLVHYKETNTLIRLSHLLPKTTQLIIVGDGPEFGKMKKKCSKLNTFFLGRIEGEELAVLYASSDIFVFPSISETYGNVINEAMASGLPIVAANGGGPRNIIVHGENGFLEEPKNEKALAARIEILVSNKKISSSIAKSARIYAEKISWSKLVAEIIEEYKELISQFKQ